MAGGWWIYSSNLVGTERSAGQAPAEADYTHKILNVLTCIMDSIALSFATAMVRPRGSKLAWLTQLATMALEEKMKQQYSRSFSWHVALYITASAGHCNTTL